jgi:hypothetical protein
MYSTDRTEALAFTLKFLEGMELYPDCQKTLVVDGKSDIKPKGWDLVEVPRVNGKFCWGRMWDAGVLTARHEKVLYLDSDRLLPKRFLIEVAKHTVDDVFVYTSMHFMMSELLSPESCRKFLESQDLGTLLLCDEYMGRVKFDARGGEPHHGPGKNVMSGSTAFTRSTYLRVGGVDHWYCDHGAYADTDFHQQTAVAGCRFVDLGLPELHYPHAKLDKNMTEVDKNELKMLALDNFIYYCNKWRLPLTLAESLAVLTGLRSPARYVNTVVKGLRAIAKVS